MRLLSKPAPFGELVHLEGRCVLLLTPIEAGHRDPPMQDWLALPVGDNGCPECGSQHWGTDNPIGYFPVRRCHDERGIGCKAAFRGTPTPHDIHRIIGALTGEKIRLARGCRHENGNADA